MIICNNFLQLHLPLSACQPAKSVGGCFTLATPYTVFRYHLLSEWCLNYKTLLQNIVHDRNTNSINSKTSLAIYFKTWLEIGGFHLNYWWNHGISALSYFVKLRLFRRKQKLLKICAKINEKLLKW